MRLLKFISPSRYVKLFCSPPSSTKWAFTIGNSNLTAVLEALGRNVNSISNCLRFVPLMNSQYIVWMDNWWLWIIVDVVLYPDLCQWSFPLLAVQNPSRAWESGYFIFSSPLSSSSFLPLLPPPSPSHKQNATVPAPFIKLVGFERLMNLKPDPSDIRTVQIVIQPSQMTVSITYVAISITVLTLYTQYNLEHAASPVKLGWERSWSVVFIPYPNFWTWLKERFQDLRESGYKAYVWQNDTYAAEYRRIGDPLVTECFAYRLWGSQTLLKW